MSNLGRAALLDSGETNKLISIPIFGIMEDLTCPVCFSTLEQTFMTPCGHNFCKGCIEECLDRKTQCPCCNASTQKTQILKNHHLDSLISTILEAREKASKQYFENLLGGSGDTTTSNNTNKQSSTQKSSDFSPIEQCFHKHMQKSLNAYESYYRSLKEKLDNSIKILRANYAGQMHDHANDAHKVDQLKTQCQAEIESIQEAFKHSASLLVTSYDEWLESRATAPKFLPIRIDVFIESRAQYLKQIVLKPTHALKDIRSLVEKKFADKNNPILEYASNARWVIRRPLLVTASSTAAASSTSATSALDDLEVIAIHDENTPIFQLANHCIEPGAEIVLKGELKFESDVPKPCFAKSPFEKGVSTMDYFTCAQCRINWICGPCAQECHIERGHSVTEYLSQHKPTWACCYCSKKRKCIKK